MIEFMVDGLLKRGRPAEQCRTWLEKGSSAHSADGGREWWDWAVIAHANAEQQREQSRANH
jgi:hypothetical protein